MSGWWNGPTGGLSQEVQRQCNERAVTGCPGSVVGEAKSTRNRRYTSSTTMHSSYQGAGTISGFIDCPERPPSRAGTPLSCVPRCSIASPPRREVRRRLDLRHQRLDAGIGNHLGDVPEHRGLLPAHLGRPRRSVHLDVQPAVDQTTRSAVLRRGGSDQLGPPLGDSGEDRGRWSSQSGEYPVDVVADPPGWPVVDVVSSNRHSFDRHGKSLTSWTGSRPSSPTGHDQPVGAGGAREVSYM